MYSIGPEVRTIMHIFSIIEVSYICLCSYVIALLTHVHILHVHIISVKVIMVNKKKHYMCSGSQGECQETTPEFIG